MTGLAGDGIIEGTGQYGLYMFVINGLPMQTQQGGFQSIPGANYAGQGGGNYQGGGRGAGGY